MIQIHIGNTGIRVLEPDNLDRLKKGKMIRVPTDFAGGITELVIDYTPDVPYVSDQVTLLFHGKDPSSIHPREIQEIVHRSKSRPEVRQRPAHPMIDVLQPATKQ